MTPSAQKIMTLPQLLEQVKKWKSAGDKIVFTNGCFDIVHLGHVDYLEKSSLLGDKMILGLNTDASVSAIKPGRPITNEESRSRVMASLGFVDAVILFGEETPYELIKAINPDILVKGDDYTVENIVGADIVMKNGGEVKTISLVQGYSTTNVINKIKQL